MLEKNVGLLLEGVEHLLAENSKLSNHQKRIQRLEQERRRIIQRKVRRLRNCFWSVEKVNSADWRGQTSVLKSTFLRRISSVP